MELIAYRIGEKFHKLPHEVRSAPWRDIQTILHIMDVEAIVKGRRHGG